jgi:hypothetical protein
MRAAALLVALACPSLTWAESQVFEMRLAGRTLGTLTFEASASGAGWTTDLGNTPLGVADGLFVATSEPVRTAEGEGARRYRGETRTTRRSRLVEVIHAAGRVLAVAITPDEDRTELSDSTLVPAGVLDPVEAFERILSAEGCPAAFSIYDGRRVVAVTPGASERAASCASCPTRWPWAPATCRPWACPRWTCPWPTTGRPAPPSGCARWMSAPARSACASCAERRPLPPPAPFML